MSIKASQITSNSTVCLTTWSTKQWTRDHQSAISLFFLWWKSIGSRWILLTKGPSVMRKAFSLLWCHNDHGGISNHQPHGCLLNCLFRRKSKKTSKLRITDLCAENSPGTGEFPTQMASNMENVSIWWRHHVVPWWHMCRACYYAKMNNDAMQSTHFTCLLLS